MSKEEKEKYYHKINNLDIQLCETNHKYIMIHQWAKDFSYKWGIFKYISMHTRKLRAISSWVFDDKRLNKIKM